MPLALLLGSAAFAQDGRSVFYGGVGQASDEEFEVDATPWSVGVMTQAANSRFIIGADIAGEGTMLDSTWGDNELRQARSFNLLVGGNIATNGTMRIDAGLLLGVRETFADCPPSYLGYQCYADTEPSVEYDANYGVIVGVSFDRTMLGVRATGESVQALVGVRF